MGTCVRAIVRRSDPKLQADGRRRRVKRVPDDDTGVSKGSPRMTQTCQKGPRGWKTGFVRHPSHRTLVSWIPSASFATVPEGALSNPSDRDPFLVASPGQKKRYPNLSRPKGQA